MARVLVIDDDSHFRGIIERIVLRSYAYSVRSVASEEEAWEELSKGSYDLILLDLYLDGRKSWDTLRRIRMLARPPTVIVISCEDIPENVEYAKALGASDFVSKPIDTARLKISVDAAIDRRGRDPRMRRDGNAAWEGGAPEIRLLVSGDPVARSEAIPALAPRRFRVFEAGDPEQAAEIVKNEQVEAALVGTAKGGGWGARQTRTIREGEGGGFRMPIVALTDADPESILDALKAGADDFITLPFDPRILAAKVEAHIRLRREYGRRWNQAASSGGRDPVTGAHNRSSLEDRLVEEFHRSQRHGRSLALGLLRLNNLDSVAARVGQHLADRVVAEVSRVLVAALRSSDVVGRYGEGEFAIILPEATPGRILPRADGVRALVEARVAALVAREREIPCIMGLAYHPIFPMGTDPSRQANSAGELIEMAHAALSRACGSAAGRLDLFGG